MIKRMLVATFFLFAVLLFMLPRTDDESKQKMASAAMLMCSNELRSAVAKQLLAEEAVTARFDNRCPDLIATLTVDEEGAIALQGAQHHIEMELTPRIEGGTVRWGCRGTPAQSVSKLCKP
jgi:hypothetical protein